MIEPIEPARVTWRRALHLPRLPTPPLNLRSHRSRSRTSNDMDFSQLNAAEQAQMSRILEKKQVRSYSRTASPVFADGRTQMQDFLKMYSNLVERCFTSCCNDFTSKALSSKEV